MGANKLLVAFFTSFRLRNHLNVSADKIRKFLEEKTGGYFLGFD